MIWLNIFDIVGTIVFAISGALAGIRKKLDLFGIITLSIVTACGGGLFRDIFIGNVPPTLFIDPKYFVVSILTALFTFFLYPVLMRSSLVLNDKNKLNLFVILDAVGLGAFTAFGAKIAITHNLTDLFSIVCMGVLTGVGGGVLRDVFIRDIPLILKQEIYASASAA
ncbi:trimeric intracellular cation channel family protein [Clostridium sp. ZS2-4]|uniref:trimeric intracellular cation channel family protein n=1 Tax=Clostridium sp. ZS2-4 TaxID=2987703 RepID=UPI00227BF890|nr:TRIC cation channel family protein [Clostridium sp. ZS2-4]MCY6354246.1 TRIC cation channel family protein [Clostridium sp. ZS2-4]